MPGELKYFERVLVNALSRLNEACEEGRIPRDDAYVFSLTSIVDNLNPNSTVPTQGSNIVVIGMPEDREAPFLLRERITFVAAVMHSVIGFMQTGFEEAKASLSENDFMMMDEDLGGDLRMKAMEACMSIISAMVEQYEEDKNQTWN